ncbi:MAG: redox-regulated ATPase YchF [Candidatus Woesearchaeota archaeon]
MLIGLVGKPSAGKSTFFKALTLAEVAIAPYPFTTIKPNEGVGFVRVDCVEKEFGVACNPREGYCSNGIRFVPIKLMDVAGLVPGAHLGKGLGLQFLDDLRQAECLIHIVDASGSTNEKGEVVAPGSYDPSYDIKFLEHELDMWFLEIIKRGWEKVAKLSQQTKKEVSTILARQLSGLNVSEELVRELISKLGLDPLSPMSWSEEVLHSLAIDLRKRTKPLLIAANKADIPESEKNIKRMVELFPDKEVVPCSAEAELALKEAAKAGLIKYLPGSSDFEVVGKLNDKQAAALEFIRQNVLKKYGSTGVQQTLDDAVFKLLGYIAVFPGGVNKLADQFGRVLPDCFLMPKNSTALDFAFRIHTDLGKAFVRAVDVRSKKTIGKDYLLKHRDVIEIVAKA